MTPCRVLLVDDDESNAVSFGMLLEDRGYTVQRTPSLAGALALSGANEFDLAILDVHLKDGRSPAIVPALRQRHPSLRVVFVSGSLRHAEQIPGADLVLSKGEEPDVLLDAIDRMVGRGPA